MTDFALAAIVPVIAWKGAANMTPSVTPSGVIFARFGRVVPIALGWVHSARAMNPASGGTMPFAGLGLHVLLAIFCAFHVVRSRQQMYWLFILFAFPLLGSLVYFFAVFLPETRLERGARRAVTKAVKALDPDRDVREARVAYDEAPTTQNQIRSEKSDFRTESVSLLMARCLAGTGRSDEARTEFEFAVAKFGTYQAKAEYAIWALVVGDTATFQRLDAEIEKVSGRWNTLTRALNEPVMRRYMAAKELAQQRYILVGESFSGPIAIALASRHLPGLAALVLVCTFARSPVRFPPLVRRGFASIPLWSIPVSITSRFLLGPSWSPALRAQLKRAMSLMRPAVWRARMRAVLAVDVEAKLREIRVPVLYLRATHDRVVPRGSSELISRCLPTTRIADVDGPHFLLQANPAECAVAVRNFAHAEGVAI